MKRFVSSRYVDALLIAMMVVVGFGAGAQTVVAPRDPSQGVAVVFWPWTPAGQALDAAAQAGAQLVRLGGLASIVIVRPDGPDYAARVKALGAVFVADPRWFGGCSGAQLS